MKLYKLYISFPFNSHEPVDYQFTAKDDEAAFKIADQYLFDFVEFNGRGSLFRIGEQIR